MKQLINLSSAKSTRLLLLLLLMALMPMSVYPITVSPTELTLKVGGEDGVINVSPEGSYFYINAVNQSDDGGETWYPVYSLYVDLTVEDSKVIVHPKAEGSTGFNIVTNEGSFKISIYVRAENSFTALTDEGVEMTFNITDENNKLCSVAAKCIAPETTGKVTVPSVANGYTVSSFESKPFQDCTHITEVVLPESVHSISWNYLFRGCSSLESVYIPKNLIQVGYGWFMGCESLTSVIVDPENSSLDSRDNCNAIIKTYSNSMVSACPATVIPETVTKLDYAAFNNLTSIESIHIPASVTSIYGWEFEGCTGLKEITFEKSIADMGEGRLMIDCNSLEKVIVLDENPCEIIDNAFNTDWNTWTTATLYVPAGCKTKYEATEGWNKFTNIVEMGGGEPEPYAVLSSDGQTVTFYYDDQKANRGGIDINNSNIYSGSSSPYGTATTAVFDTSFASYRPESTAYWFIRCGSLTTITGIENLKTDNVTNMQYMFFGCSGLTSLDVSGFNTSNVTNMGNLFDGCSGLTNLDVSGFNTSNVTDMGWMFGMCSGLTSLDVSGFNTSNVTETGYMFCGCSGLTSLDVSGFDTSNVWQMLGMFRDCSSLTSLDLNGFDTSNVTDMRQMFLNSPSLTIIYAGDNWSTANVTDSEYMFTGCASLVGGNGTVFDANHTDAEYARIDKPGQPGYFTQKEPELEPIDNADFSSDIDEETDLDGNVVGDIYYNISSGDGSYDPSEGCIVVTTPTDDSVIDGQDIFGEDFQAGFTGIVFMVPEGKGTVKVEAETTGTMVLKVKIGNNDPIEMELEGRLKVSFPYNVTEPTYVYIYGGTASAAPDMAGSAAATGELRLYGVEVVKGETGVGFTPTLSQGEGAWYSLDGRKLQGKPTQKGVYIMNGKKVVIK